jgi:hypothetical protein
LVSFFIHQSLDLAVQALRILSFNLIFTNISLLTINHILIPMGRESAALICLLCGALSSMLFFGLTSINYSLSKVATFSIASEFLVAVCGLWFARSICKDVLMRINVIEVFVSASIMIVVVYYSRRVLTTDSISGAILTSGLGFSSYYSFVHRRKIFSFLLQNLKYLLEHSRESR